MFVLHFNDHISRRYVMLGANWNKVSVSCTTVLYERNYSDPSPTNFSKLNVNITYNFAYNDIVTLRKHWFLLKYHSFCFWICNMFSLSITIWCFMWKSKWRQFRLSIFTRFSKNSCNNCKMFAIIGNLHCIILASYFSFGYYARVLL